MKVYNEDLYEYLNDFIIDWIVLLHDEDGQYIWPKTQINRSVL